MRVKGEVFWGEPNHWMAFGFYLLFFVSIDEHFDAGEDQKGSENIQNPLESCYQEGPGKDKQEPKNHCAYDAPKKHTMI